MVLTIHMFSFIYMPHIHKYSVLPKDTSAGT